MNIRNKAALLFLGLGILDLLSVFFPITAAFGIFIIWRRPQCFLKAVMDIYEISITEKKEER